MVLMLDSPPFSYAAVKNLRGSGIRDRCETGHDGTISPVGCRRPQSGVSTRTRVRPNSFPGGGIQSLAVHTDTCSVAVVVVAPAALVGASKLGALLKETDGRLTC